MKSLKSISESVRQRLFNLSKIDKRPFNEILQYYAMERFLYRLSQSGHADRFILKGALMHRVWQSHEFRPTMDIDMLGRTKNEISNITAQIREIIAVKVVPDGLVFDPDTILTDRIAEDAEYEGIRVKFRGSLGSARINMQIDIGFGDIVYPEPGKADFPTLMDSPALALYCYSRESTIAEKFEAMVKLGFLNSRMKDFYDIWLLSRQFRFERTELEKAIRLTFEQRGTSLSLPENVLSAEFIRSKQSMWAAFRKRLEQEHIPASFHVIVTDVETFLTPVFEEKTVVTIWEPKGIWT
ncbi:MAG: nucleotidyl transferase AbiEii/AbiGii toxin family protein [Bacteroidota bacterium]